MPEVTLSINWIGIAIFLGYFSIMGLLYIIYDCLDKKEKEKK